MTKHTKEYAKSWHLTCRDDMTKSSHTKSYITKSTCRGSLIKIWTWNANAPPHQHINGISPTGSRQCMICGVTRKKQELAYTKLNNTKCVCWCCITKYCNNVWHNFKKELGVIS